MKSRFEGLKRTAKDFAFFSLTTAKLWKDTPVLQTLTRKRSDLKGKKKKERKKRKEIQKEISLPIGAGRVSDEKEDHTGEPQNGSTISGHTQQGQHDAGNMILESYVPCSQVHSGETVGVPLGKICSMAHPESSQNHHPGIFTVSVEDVRHKFWGLDVKYSKLKGGER